MPAIASQRHPIQPPIRRYHAVKTSGTHDALVVSKLPISNIDIDGPAFSTSWTVVKLVRCYRQAGTGANHSQSEFVENITSARINLSTESRRIGHARYNIETVFEKKWMRRWDVRCPEKFAFV